MICGACAFRSQCEPAHLVAKAALRSHFGIEIKRRRSTSIAATLPAPGEDDMPHKIVTLLHNINATGIDIKVALQSGVNPFSSTLKFMAIACHLVMKMPKVNAGLIAQGCVKMLGCQQATAETYAKQAIIVLTHVGAVSNTNGVISLKRG